MKTRVMTTDPAGHTVSIFDGMLSAYQVADEYMEFYDDIDIFHEDCTIPEGWYIRCYKENHNPILYQIKWNNLY